MSSYIKTPSCRSGFLLLGTPKQTYCNDEDPLLRSGLSGAKWQAVGRAVSHVCTLCNLGLNQLNGVKHRRRGVVQ